MTNEQTYREILERLVKAYDSGVVMSSDKTGYWNVLQEAKELLKQPAPEPGCDLRAVCEELRNKAQSSLGNYGLGNHVAIHRELFGKMCAILDLDRCDVCHGSGEIVFNKHGGDPAYDESKPCPECSALNRPSPHE